MRHFDEHHSRTIEAVPLPKKQDSKQLGESRSQAVRRFLDYKQQFQSVESVFREYFTLDHAEPVPQQDLNKDHTKVFYLPMHVVRKDSSSSTKIRAVFDASAKSTSGVSLNDLLMVGLTVHPSLICPLSIQNPPCGSHCRCHKDVSCSGVNLGWRGHNEESLRDYRMKRITFGVSASCFAANMAVKRNTEDLEVEFPLASQIVIEC